MKIEIEGKVARLHAGAGAPVQEIPVATLVGAIAAAAARKPDSAILPAHVRAWRERGAAVAIALEYAPALRTVRWSIEGSGDRSPFGASESYEFRRLALPYVIVLSVFQRGQLTPVNQLFYRTASLSDGEELYMSNLLNVVGGGYQFKSWVCLLNLEIDGDATWAQRVRAIGEHVFATGWNRSAERHEGDSCFYTMRDLDPRIATVDAWEQASRENPSFPLEVRWKPAGTTVSQELEHMLDVVAPRARVASAEELTALVLTERAKSRRRGIRRWFP